MEPRKEKGSSECVVSASKNVYQQSRTFEIKTFLDFFPHRMVFAMSIAIIMIRYEYIMPLVKALQS